MYDLIVSAISSGEIINSVSNGIDTLAALIDSSLSGVNNLRIASIILMLLAFVLFLFLVIIIYVKSLIAFLKSDNSQSKGEEIIPDEIFNEEDEKRLNQIIEEQERERELEKELSKELELARIERENLERQQKEKDLKKTKEEKAREKEQKSKKRQEKETAEDQVSESRSRELRHEAKNLEIDLDWRKGKLAELEKELPPVNSDLMSYHQSTKELSELLGLIIDMIGRGVDDLKIAQTVMFRNQGRSSEDDIFQVIDAIKSFINLAAGQKFETLPNRGILPKEDEALYHLAESDPTLALALMEAYMDFNIDRSAKAPLETKEKLYKEISGQAVIFGTLASINDLLLATGAFELAIELSPTNINAWSRLGDMYARAETTNKAIWAYQNILDVADAEIYAPQVANANKMMSQYLYAQGNSLKAAKMFNQCKQFYDSLGINRRLDKQEVEVVEIIEAHQKEELKTTIQKLLNQQSSKVYEFI